MRKVLQAENVGPDGNPLRVLRVVAYSNQCEGLDYDVEVVNLWGVVVLRCGTYGRETHARIRANHVYEVFKKHDGVDTAVRDELGVRL